MNKQVLRADILLLITALVWGFSFVAQKAGMDSVGAFAFNAIRFPMGALSLVPLIFLRSRRKNGENAASDKVKSKKTLVISSLILGTALFMAVGFQQVGMVFTSVGNSGFITGMYVVFVPIAGIFLKRKTGIPTWVGALLAFLGLFFVSVLSNITHFSLGTFFSSVKEVLLNINKGDMLVFVCSILFTFHVLLMDNLVKKVDAIQLSCGQFLVCGIWSILASAINIAKLTGAADAAAALGIPLGPELFTAAFTLNNVIEGAIPLLYGGLLSAGVAYTLQAVAQQYAPPAHATIIMCSESVFAAVGGVLFRSEPLTAAKLIGFILMLTGMLATQWDVIGLTKKDAKKSETP